MIQALRKVITAVPGKITIDKSGANAAAIRRVQADSGAAIEMRRIKYLNDIVEQDHRSIKRRVRASQGFRAFHSASRTLQGIETMNMIRKGQVRWIAKDDVAGQAMFVEHILGLTIR